MATSPLSTTLLPVRPSRHRDMSSNDRRSAVIRTKTRDTSVLRGRIARSVFWLAVLTALFLEPSAASAQCKTMATLAPGDHNDSLTFENTRHDFVIHLPPGYDGRTRLPLMLDLHGSGSDSEQQLLFSGSPAVADANNFIVVAPNGYMNSWNGDIAYGAAYEQKLNDVGFMKALVDYVSTLAAIDRTRVYATGLSNGAAMSNTLGCQATDVFAGIAPVADPLDISLPTCMPLQPIAVIGFHGYDDEFVPYEGGPGEGPMLPTPFPSTADTLKAWGRVMGCSGEPEITPIRGDSKCEIYRTCGHTTQVGYCSLEGGHLLYLQDVMNIADYAWKFLSQFTLTLPDTDQDGINDQDDNCARIANPDQTDSDGNCIGDACECETASDCDDESFCNGPELCTAGQCEPGTSPCATGEQCVESVKSCKNETQAAAPASAAQSSGNSSPAADGGAPSPDTASAGTPSRVASAEATAASAMAASTAHTQPSADTASTTTTAPSCSTGCSAALERGADGSALACLLGLGAYTLRHSRKQRGRSRDRRGSGQR